MTLLIQISISNNLQHCHPEREAVEGSLSTSILLLKFSADCADNADF
jgi:hypothetical protein